MKPLVLAGVILLLTSCASWRPDFQEPEVLLANLEMLPGEGFEQRARLTLRIQNPNDVAIPIEGMSFTLELQGSKFATGVSDQKLVVEPFSEALLKVEVATNIYRAGRILMDMMNTSAESLDYRLITRIRTDRFLFGTESVVRSGQIDPARILDGNQP